MPKVSVIIPVYNVENYLRKCLDSVVGQTLKDIEIICVDDGSTDGSGAILDEYAQKDERIKVIHQENQGSGAARNVGIDLAKGEYIGFVDSDDYINDVYFENLHNIAIKNEANVAATSDVIVCEKNKHYRKYMGISQTDTILVKNIDKEQIILATGVSWNKIYKKSFLIENEIECCQIRSAAEDNYFTVLATIFANKIAVTHTATYYYLMRDTSQVHEKRTDYLFFDVYNQIRKKIKESQLSNHKKEYWLNVVNARLLLDSQSLLLRAKEKDKEDIIKQLKKETSPIVISLTSFPARIGTVHQTIETLLNQTVKADKVILWLAKEQFPLKEKDLPTELLKLTKIGLEIEWCHDIKSFKKLVPALKKYPESIIVTVDDDVLYPNNWLELLLVDYFRHPNMICCHRAHCVVFDDMEKIAPYRHWPDICISETPSFRNFFTGVGGVLYPPYCLDKDVFNEEKFMRLCPQADDIWFWAMAVKNNTEIQVVENNITNLKYIPGTQEAETCLWKTNIGIQNLNDVQLKNILEEYPEILPKVLAEPAPQFKQNVKPSITKYKLFGFVPLVKIETV